MLSTTVRRQLLAFLAVSVLALGVLGVRYLQIPADLGVGRYDVRVEMPDAGGLYDGAPVTYRGVEVGRVARTDLTDQGAAAVVRLESGTRIPADARVEVQNRSAVGEPYLGFVDDGSRTSEDLREGDTVPASRVRMPVSTAELLTRAEALMRSVSREDLRTTVTEAARALRGSSDPLGRILDSGARLTASAVENQEATTSLIENSQTVLATQRDLQAQTRATVTGLAGLAEALAQADPDLRRLLVRTAPAADAVGGLLDDVRVAAANLLVDAADLGEVLNVYRPALKHLLIVLPGLVEANGSAQVYYPDQQYGESGLSFKLTVNNPPVCTKGFPEAGDMRNPADLRPKALPEDSYCKEPKDDPRVVRGARNMPCPNDPTRRGAVAAECGLVFNPKEPRR